MCVCMCQHFITSPNPAGFSHAAFLLKVCPRKGVQKAAFCSHLPGFICSLQANFQQKELLKHMMSRAACRHPRLGQVWLGSRSMHQLSSLSARYGSPACTSSHFLAPPELVCGGKFVKMS